VLRYSHMATPMLAKLAAAVKHTGGAGSMPREDAVLRRLVRVVVLSVITSAAMALVRWVLGRLAGQASGPVPTAGSNGAHGRGIPLSFDAWPPVPEAPQRSNG